MMVASHINRYTDIILRRERLYVITCSGVWFYTVSHFTPKAGLGLPRVVRYEFYETGFFFTWEATDTIYGVCWWWGCVSCGFGHRGVCNVSGSSRMYATLLWYNSNMNVDTSNQWPHLPEKGWPVSYTESFTAQDTSLPLHWSQRIGV